MKPSAGIFKRVAPGALLALWAVALNAGDPPRTDAKPPAGSATSYVSDVAQLVGQPESELRDVVERFTADRAALGRRYRVEYSPQRRAQMREFYSAWLAALDGIRFEGLAQPARVDYLLLRNRIRWELALLAREEQRLKEMAPLVPFAGTIFDLEEARRRMETPDAEALAATLARLADEVEKTRKAVEAGLKPEPSEGAIKASKIVAYRAAELSENLRRTLEQWFGFYKGYDPVFTWWNSAPHKKADDALRTYVKSLREKVVGIREGEDEPIIGDPIGREALVADLAFEMIPYTPEELVAIAERELAWCEAEMRRAARDMGLGDDWKAALERVKNQHVSPGEQPDVIRELAREAIAFVEQRNLVTVPPLARDIWRMEMLSPERQKENPFFLGGEVIQVSFPTDTMTQEDKLMTMRGNNVHFARATVFHELIPGHHLQGFMTERYNPHRRAFATPFWTEGWAFYWEMVFWDLNFPRSPEDRVGMLFWRMHRAARIIFSLGFHLGTMTPQQCVDFLVDRVGHERANATGEVRRSFRGNYPPLYQIAYMIGGLQFRALRHELVDSGRMTERDFHDAGLRNGRIPVEMIRALLTRQPLARDYSTQWKFEGAAPSKR
jgi:uncharacterized protein (DUF885 family)